MCHTETPLAHQFSTFAVFRKTQRVLIDDNTWIQTPKGSYLTTMEYGVGIKRFFKAVPLPFFRIGQSDSKILYKKAKDLEQSSDLEK